MLLLHPAPLLYETIKNILQFGLHQQMSAAIENKIPSGSGILDGEGNVIGHPTKRQYSKSCI